MHEDLRVRIREIDDAADRVFAVVRRWRSGLVHEAKHTFENRRTQLKEVLKTI